MQTTSIQATPTNNAQRAPKSPPLSSDFKQTLSAAIDQDPVCSAPEQPPAQATTKPVAKQQARPSQSQQAQQSQQARDAAAAPDAQPESAGADVADATAPAPAQPAEETTEPGKDEAAAAATAEPMASMLAMLAAYKDLAAAKDTKTGPALEEPATAGDPNALAALQADGKRPQMELSADMKLAKGRPDGTSTLQLAQADKANAEQLAKLGGDARQLTADQKDESFAAKLADAAPQQQLQQVLPPAAQALAGAAQAANAVASSQLQARVGSAAWDQQLGQKVVWMVAGGDQSASLTLNPPDLGPLQVVLNVSNDSASASFTAANPETRQAIENALPKLREMMSEAGIELGNATVSAGTQDQQQAFAEQARSQGGRRGANGLGNGGGEGDGQQDATQPVIRRSVLGAVDTFA